jgi:hypothetical protein
MAMAGKLTVDQLRQSIQSGSLPAYIGIPMIEEKNKEKEQMAAAQQGFPEEQKSPSVTAQILQKAEQQEFPEEQQSQGIDQLPSNLPTEQDEAMGMADGGIVAFAEGDLVEDQMLRDSYNPPRPSRGRYDTPGPVGNFIELFRKNAASEPNLEDPLSAISGLTQESLAADEARIEALPAQEQAAEKARVAKMLRQMEAERQQIIKQRQTEATARLGFLNQSAPETAAKFAQENQSVLNPQAAQPQARQADANLDNQMLIDSNAGITAAPGATGPRTAPQGATGPRTAPQGGAPSSGRGALPPTLAAAERSDSPVADRATSMLDKYVAQLEKSGEDVGRQKKEALYMALIQGGLGMMGGTSPNAFANIAAGMLPATQAYQQSMRDIKKDDRARIEKLINAGLSKEKFAMELRKLGIEDKKADAMINYYNARAGAAGAGGGNDIKTANAIRGLDSQLSTNLARVDTQIKNLNSANPMMAAYVNKSPDQIPKGIRDQVTAYRTQLGKLEGEKNKWVNLHSSRVQSLGGVTLGDIEGASGGGNMPKGIPPGSKQVGTSGGKPVYESPDGKRYIVE